MPRVDFSGPNNPSDCGECRQLFEMHHMDQVEALHIARTEGEDAAERWLNEKYEEEHANH